ncbi:MAG: hypothetical protein KGJ02_07365 [Verrucomicrobiota bacterium]|nr:hypothetical protein [Verrucomicrobiota bacterium]
MNSPNGVFFGTCSGRNESANEVSLQCPRSVCFSGVYVGVVEAILTKNPRFPIGRGCRIGLVITMAVLSPLIALVYAVARGILWGHMKLHKGNEAAGQIHQVDKKPSSDNDWNGQDPAQAFHDQQTVVKGPFSSQYYEGF